MKKHPHLAKKLSQLYSSCINSSVNSNSALAKHLGISRQAISKWTNGSETSVGDCIPNSQIQNVAAVFGLEPHLFTLELDEFRQKLQSKLEPDTDQYPSPPGKLSLSLLPITDLQLIGRSSEIDLLNESWHRSKTNCLQIVAFGGVGKSSLVNSWLSQLDRNNYFGAERVYGWSFYWQGTGSEVTSAGDLFMEQALHWFGDETPNEGTPWAKANRLANLVRKSKTLLILDGLEPLQYPPGPKQGAIENPAVALLIRELAANNNGLCVITSRMAISDFSPFDDGRIQSLQLNHLSTADGVQFLRNMGIKGDNADMEAAVSEYAGHPLCLSLLGGYLSVVHGGNVSKYTKLNSLVDVQPYDIHANKIVLAYLNWFEGSFERSLLNLLGLFDRGISLSDVKKLASTESISGLTEELLGLSVAQWGYAVKKLDDANLISVDNRGSRCMIDCHPLVRDFLNEHIKTETPDIWTKGNSLIFRYLQSHAAESPSTMVQLEPLFRAVIHGTRAGLYEEAFQLYFKRIKREQFSMFTEGSHHADQSCIRCFFLRPWTDPVSQLPETASFYLLSCAAANLIYLGKIDEAIGPSMRSIQWFQKNERWFEAAATAGPLVSMLIAGGRLQDARQQVDLVRESVRKADNAVLTAVAASVEAYLYFLEGDRESARQLFEQAELCLNETDPGCVIACPTISSYYCKYLLDSGESEKALQRSLKTIGWRESKSWQVAVDTTSLYASDLFVLGLIYLDLGDIQQAAQYLNRQVELLKAANEWLYLPSGLIARAQLYLRTSQFSLARQDIEEALAIAQKTAAQFSEWEAYIALAELSLEVADLRQGQDYFMRAMAIEGINSYRHRADELIVLERRLFPDKGDVSICRH